MKCEQSSVRRWARGLAIASLALAAGLPVTAAQSAASAPAAAGLPGVPGHEGVMPRKTVTPQAPVKPVDINSASRKELKTLPGIGDAEAAKIVANRPYMSKAELVGKDVLPIGPYLSIKNQIIALPKGRAKGKAQPASAPTQAG